MPKKATTFKDLKSLRALDLGSLQKELSVTQKELYVFRMTQSANELKQSHLIRIHSRQIARIQTLITELAVQA